VIDSDAIAEPWYCQIHGTVRRCPFKWLACDYGPLDVGHIDTTEAGVWWRPEPGELPLTTDQS